MNNLIGIIFTESNVDASNTYLPHCINTTVDHIGLSDIFIGEKKTKKCSYTKCIKCRQAEHVNRAQMFVPVLCDLTKANNFVQKDT